MPGTPRVGVCIVRAEMQRNRLLITVLANMLVGRTLEAVAPIPARHFVDIADASEAVADFLQAFALASPRRGFPERRGESK